MNLKGIDEASSSLLPSRGGGKVRVGVEVKVRVRARVVGVRWAFLFPSLLLPGPCIGGIELGLGYVY